MTLSIAISRCFRGSPSGGRQHAGTLSGGEKKLLSFVRGLAEGSAVVVIDEPTEGVQFENVVRMDRPDRGTQA